MSGGQPYYLTTPIYYVNDQPHIGHAYTTVATDALARFMRLDGRRVMFLTGTDEHGQKVDKSARAAGLDTQTFCDRVSQNFREVTQLMNISNDQFIRTTEPRHIKASQAIWRAIAAHKSPKGRDNIYLGKYAGWYAVRDEAFYGEEELTTDAAGKKHAPSGAEVEWLEEPSYFFRLSDWQDWLLDYYERHPDFIGPEGRRTEVVSFVCQEKRVKAPDGTETVIKGPLTDLSISRTSFSWGVPVPGDPKHVMYVWLDALTNYLTAIGYPDTESEDFRSFWPADLHMVGKDIIRFHCVYWPAFLAAAGLAVPKRVFGHGWWTVEGQKMSKTLANTVAPKLLVGEFGADAVRYFMLRELPFGSDGDFSRHALIGRINSDLAHGLGNFAQRVLSMIQLYCDAKVPLPGEFAATDVRLLGSARSLLSKLRIAFSEQAFHKATETIWAVLSDADLYITEHAPWEMHQAGSDRLPTVLYTLAEVTRHLATLVQPVLPAAAADLLDQLGQGRDSRDFVALAAHPLSPGTKLPPPHAIFPALELSSFSRELQAKARALAQQRARHILEALYGKTVTIDTAMYREEISRLWRMCGGKINGGGGISDDPKSRLKKGKAERNVWDAAKGEAQQRAQNAIKALLQEECAEDITTYKDEVERLWRICGGKPDKRQSQDVTIRAPPERIFDALTNPKRRTQWWGKPDYQGAQMESDLRADGRWVQSGEWRNGKSFQVAGVYRTVDRAHLLAFSWRSCTDKSGLESLVQFDLKEENGNTTVRVTQSGPEGTLLPERRWEEVLASLRKYVEGPTAS